MDRPLPPQSRGHADDAPDALEALLRQQSWSAPPPALRDAILAAAQEAATRHTASAHPTAEINGHTHPYPHSHPHEYTPAPTLSFWERLQSGWCVLAGAWALVLALNAYSTAGLEPAPPQYPPFSEATLAQLRSEAQEIASLGATDPFPARRSATTPGASPRLPSPPTTPGDRDRPRARGPHPHSPSHAALPA